jgi:hypothetical protein
MADVAARHLLVTTSPSLDSCQRRHSRLISPPSTNGHHCV